MSELGQLGKYQLTRVIGAGASAEVFQGQDTTLGRDVAVKVLFPHLLYDPSFVRRFYQEARTVAALAHPNIVTIYEVGQEHGRLFIVMELARESLATRLHRTGALPWPAALRLLQPICAALDFAHGLGVVHRDLKPGNILMSAHEAPLIADFGFAHVLGEQSQSITIGSSRIVGTGPYVAPELWDGQAASAASDMYALGCIIVELITGAVLFSGATPMQVMRAHALGPRLPAAWPRGVPDGVEQVLRRVFASDPEQRPQRALALYDELAGLSTATRPALAPSGIAQPAAAPPVAEQIVSTPPVAGQIASTLPVAGQIVAKQPSPAPPVAEQPAAAPPVAEQIVAKQPARAPQQRGTPTDTVAERQAQVRAAVNGEASAPATAPAVLPQPQMASLVGARPSSKPPVAAAHDTSTTGAATAPTTVAATAPVAGAGEPAAPAALGAGPARAVAARFAQGLAIIGALWPIAWLAYGPISNTFGSYWLPFGAQGLLMGLGVGLGLSRILTQGRTTSVLLCSGVGFAVGVLRALAFEQLSANSASDEWYRVTDIIILTLAGALWALASRPRLTQSTALSMAGGALGFFFAQLMARPVTELVFNQLNDYWDMFDLFQFVLVGLLGGAALLLIAVANARRAAGDGPLSPRS